MVSLLVQEMSAEVLLLIGLVVFGLELALLGKHQLAGQWRHLFENFRITRSCRSDVPKIGHIVTEGVRCFVRPFPILTSPPYHTCQNGRAKRHEVGMIHRYPL